MKKNCDKIVIVILSEKMAMWYCIVAHPIMHFVIDIVMGL